MDNALRVKTILLFCLENILHMCTYTDAIIAVEKAQIQICARYLWTLILYELFMMTTFIQSHFIVS